MTDYQGLMRRLRMNALPEEGWLDLMDEAADAIEALLKEREKMRGILGIQENGPGIYSRELSPEEVQWYTKTKPDPARCGICGDLYDKHGEPYCVGPIPKSHD